MLVLSVHGQPMLTYRVYDSGSIVFKPIFHSDMVVNDFPPKINGDGYRLVFPNGKEIIDRRFPNSEKTKFEFVKQNAR